MIPGFMARNLADWITGLLLLAMLYVLSKPDSQGAEFITAFTGAMVQLIKTATDVGGGGEGD